VPIYALGDDEPAIHSSAYVHPDAVVIGKVTLGVQSSVWPGAILRGDHGSITVGDRTSVQDGTVVHTTQRAPTRIGADCVVGHNVHIEGAVIADRCMIGSGSLCLNGVEIGAGSLVAAGAVVTPKTVAPPGSRLIGAPARVSPHPDSGQFDEYLDYAIALYLNNTANYPGQLRRLDP
jgi:carbonic anhydrase/acetyltransferase-like protein (isoleucine patch superfamily)